MALRPVDFQGVLTADLPRGRIEARDKRRLLALPAEWLESLVARAPADATTALGSALGAALEAEARAALDDVREASPEDVAYALSAALAVRGMGTVELERWGDALALLWHDPPGTTEAWNDLAAAAVGALVAKLTGLDVAAAPIGRVDGALRVLLASSAVCALARQRARAGDALPQILALLVRSSAEDTESGS